MTSTPFIRKLGLVSILTSMIGCSQAELPKVQDGDIIFQRSLSRQSAAISAATHSEYTHVGIIFIENGSPFVYEAVQPVQKTPLDKWIDHGENQLFVVKRLRDQAKINFPRLNQEVIRFLNKDYDWLFDWSDSRIYCSELVWKSYQRSSGIEIGNLKHLEDFDLKNPIVRKALIERYGEDIPYSMKVISPADLFNSDKLERVK